MKSGSSSTTRTLGMTSSTIQAGKTGVRPSQADRVAPSRTRQAPHSGIFPCFLGGLVSRFVASARRAWISLGRVSRGSMISST